MRGCQHRGAVARAWQLLAQLAGQQELLLLQHAFCPGSLPLTPVPGLLWNYQCSLGDHLRKPMRTHTQPFTHTVTHYALMYREH